MKRWLKRAPLGRWLLVPYRLWAALRVVGRPIGSVPAWLFRSREIVNFTFDLNDLSIAYLAQFCSEVSGAPREEVSRFVAEIEQDQQLREHVRRLGASSPERAVSDACFRLGKRALYYVLVRALRPKLVFEAGVDQGLGSCAIAAALIRNAGDGSPGRLLACDVKAGAGHFFQAPYDSWGTLAIGDALLRVAEVDEPIDLLIQDVTPSFDEPLLNAAKDTLASDATLVSAWHRGGLMRFAASTDRRYLAYVEEPLNHWVGVRQYGVAFGSRSDVQSPRPGARP